MSEYTEFHNVKVVTKTGSAVLILFNTNEPAESFTEWIPFHVIEENAEDCISMPKHPQGPGWLAVRTWWANQQGLESVDA